MACLIRSHNDLVSAQRIARTAQTARHLPLLLTDNDDDIINDRISQCLRAMRDNNRSSARHPESDAGARSVIRDELDSFARTLAGAQFRVFSDKNVSKTVDGYGTIQGLSTKMAQTRSDLEQLEKLISQTFGGSSAAISHVDVIPFEDTLDSAADRYVYPEWRESSSMAAMAVRWAEERRRKVERDIAASGHDFHVSPMDLVTRSQRTNSHQSLLELGDSYASGSPLPQYRRSLSAVEPVRRPAVLNGINEHGVAKTTSFKPEMSEARRKLRAVLCKSKGDPHYFERSQDD